MNTAENRVKTDALVAKASEISLTVLKITGQIVIGLAKMVGTILAGLYVLAASKKENRSTQTNWADRTEEDALADYEAHGEYIAPDNDNL